MSIEKLQAQRKGFERYLQRATKLSNKTIKQKLKAIDDFIMFVAISELIK